MQTTKHAPVRRERPSAGAILGMMLIVPLYGCDSSCFLDRTGRVIYQRYDMTATIQSQTGAGVRSTIVSTNLASFSGSSEMPVFGAGASDPNGPQRVAEMFTRYLREVTERRAGDAAFRALHGEPPYCIVSGSLTGTATGPTVSSDDVRVYASDAPPLETCPCGAACSTNPPGVFGELAVEPSGPGAPLTVAFGAVPVGGAQSIEVTLRNVAPSAQLCLDRPRVLEDSANPGDFTVVPMGCEPSPEGAVVLPPDGTCVFNATFRPTASGARSARVPGVRGCGDAVTLTGEGIAGRLVASPAPACFRPPVCSERPIRVDNDSDAAVRLLGFTIDENSPTRWTVVRFEDAAGAPFALSGAPYTLAPHAFVRAVVRACGDATSESTLRIDHDGNDYGSAETGPLTGDLDSRTPLAVRLLPPASGCMD